MAQENPPEEQIPCGADSPAPGAASLEEERDRFKSALQRAQADLVNYRTRAEAERRDLLQHGNSRLLGRLLPVVDELTLALGQNHDGPSQESWLEGFRLIARKLNTVLEAEGVERIEALGKPFDPSEHEALAQQETPDHQDGQVLLVVREGYRRHGRLLRAAQVIVAQNPAPAADNVENNKFPPIKED